MKTAARILLVLLGLGLLAVGVPQANAATCNFFTVTADASVPEGGKAKVTVKRSGNDKPSSVKVSTNDGSATSPDDFAELDEQVSFTTELEKVLYVKTVQDKVHEGLESFTVKVSDGAGCYKDSEFIYGAPARVTIKDDDPITPSSATPSVSPTPTPTETATPEPSATPTESPSPSPSETPTIEPSPTFSATPVPIKDSSNVSPFLVGLAVFSFVLAAGLAFALARTTRREKI